MALIRQIEGTRVVGAWDGHSVYGSMRYVARDLLHPIRVLISVRILTAQCKRRPATVRFRANTAEPKARFPRAGRRPWPDAVQFLQQCHHLVIVVVEWLNELLQLLIGHHLYCFSDVALDSVAITRSVGHTRTLYRRPHKDATFVPKGDGGIPCRRQE